jgi:hypothetical protein
MNVHTLRASASTLNNGHLQILTSTASIIRDISYTRSYCQHKDVHRLIWQTCDHLQYVYCTQFLLFACTHFTVTKISWKTEEASTLQRSL